MAIHIFLWRQYTIAQDDQSFASLSFVQQDVTITVNHLIKGSSLLSYRNYSATRCPLQALLRFPQSLAVSFSPCSSEGTAQKGRIENT
jgi:hypothetical protein